MARRRRRESQYRYGAAGEPYFRSTLQGDVPRAPRDVSRYEAVPYVVPPLHTEYPWYASPAVRRLAVFTTSPYRHAGRRSEAMQSLSGLGLRVPDRVRFCVQRKQRRQVLFAQGRAGFGGSAPKRHYVRRAESAWRC